MQISLVWLLLAAFALNACTRAAGLPTRDEAALVVLRFAQTGSRSALVLSRYDPISREADTSTGADLALTTSPSAGLQSETVAHTIRPGTYVISRFMQQEHWGLCFAQATQSFVIGPGDVLLLGRFDALAFTSLLDADVHRRHAERLVGSRSGIYDFVEFRGSLRCNSARILPEKISSGRGI